MGNYSTNIDAMMERRYQFVESLPKKDSAMELYEPQFTRSDVVSVTGVDTEALKSWLKHGFVAVSPLQEGGHQKRRFFSVMDMIKIAVISKLTLLTVNSSIANEIISSKNFPIWVDRCLSEYADGGASQYHFAAMHYDGSRILVDFISDEDQLAILRRGDGSTTARAQALIVVPLLDIVSEVLQGAKHLLRDEAPPENLTAAQRAIHAMENHRRKAKEGTND